MPRERPKETAKKKKKKRLINMMMDDSLGQGVSTGEKGGRKLSDLYIF